MRPAALMLFAAGRGTRMGALTADWPKPLLPVAGRPLIDHALALADAAGIARIVVNTHYLGDQIEAHLAGRPAIRISHETPALLDTGGGLGQALPLLESDPVFTLNSDAVWTGPNPLIRLAEAWDPERMDGLVLLVPRAAAHGHLGAGDFILDDEGRVRRGKGAIYTGAQIVKTGGLAAIGEAVFSLNRLWDRMLAGGRLYGLLHEGEWCDVGHPGGIAEAEALLARARHV